MRDLIPEEVQQVYGAQGEGKKPGPGFKWEKGHYSKGHWTGHGKNRKYEKDHRSKGHWTNPKNSRG